MQKGEISHFGAGKAESFSKAHGIPPRFCFWKNSYLYKNKNHGAPGPLSKKNDGTRSFGFLGGNLGSHPKKTHPIWSFITLFHSENITKLHSLKLTKTPLKIGAWFRFLLVFGLFSGTFAVTFRECTCCWGRSIPKNPRGSTPVGSIDHWNWGGCCPQKITSNAVSKKLRKSTRVSGWKWS